MNEPGDLNSTTAYGQENHSWSSENENNPNANVTPNWTASEQGTEYSRNENYYGRRDCPPYQSVYRCDGAVEDNKNQKTAKSFGLGAIILTSLISIVCCCATMYGILKLRTADNNNMFTPNDAVATNIPAGNASPKEGASAGLTIGNGDVTNSDADEDTGVIKECMRTVVNINVQVISDSYYFGDSVSTSSGSGVIVTEDGYIVTCNHVIEGASSISVSLQDGTTYNADIVGFDSRTDLAVIKIDGNDLPSAIIGDSNAYEVGNSVYAIGNPLGEYASTVTDGIISGIDRSVEIDGIVMTLMQTNAAINPGNSGGGLFSADTGELIGIVNAKNYGEEIEGLGFAIPTSLAHDIIVDLMELGYVTGRPYMGITMQSVQVGPYMFENSQRVLITGVNENSPAEKAGLKKGDYLMKFGGVDINNTEDLSNVLSNYNAGDEVEIQILRNNQYVTLTIVLGEASG